MKFSLLFEKVMMIIRFLLDADPEGENDPDPHPCSYINFIWAYSLRWLQYRRRDRRNTRIIKEIHSTQNKI